jgi:hypothetical protein
MGCGGVWWSMLAGGDQLRVHLPHADLLPPRALHFRIRKPLNTPRHPYPLNDHEVLNNNRTNPRFEIPDPKHHPVSTLEP